MRSDGRSSDLASGVRTTTRTIATVESGLKRVGRWSGTKGVQLIKGGAQQALPEKLRHGEVCRRRRPAPEKLGPAVTAAIPSSQPTRPAPDAPAR